MKGLGQFWGVFVVLVAACGAAEGLEVADDGSEETAVAQNDASLKASSAAGGRSGTTTLAGTGGHCHSGCVGNSLSLAGSCCRCGGLRGVYAISGPSSVVCIPTGPNP
jgi:hypothetical protein